MPLERPPPRVRLPKSISAPSIVRRFGKRGNRSALVTPMDGTASRHRDLDHGSQFRFDGFRDGFAAATFRLPTQIVQRGVWVSRFGQIGGGRREISTLAGTRCCLIRSCRLHPPRVKRRSLPVGGGRHEYQRAGRASGSALDCSTPRREILTILHGNAIHVAHPYHEDSVRRVLAEEPHAS